MQHTRAIAHDIAPAPRAGRGGPFAAPARAFRDFVLPPLCPVCRAHIDVAGMLCGVCWATVAFIGPPLCDRLGLPLPYAAGGTQLSPAAIARPPAYDRARAVALHAGAVRDLVHGLKYGDRHEGVEILSRWLAIAGRDLLADADVIVPAPLHRMRLWSRRFNQASLLASRVSKLAHVPVAPFLLERRRATESQVGMTAKQRKRNVAGAFKVAAQHSDMVRGRKIVLIDDVLTTGATAEACARVLRRAGAARIDVLVVAMARPTGAA